MNLFYNLNTSFFLIIVIFLNLIILNKRKIISYKIKILDYPDHRKIHTEPTPLIGGVCIFFTLIFSTFINFFLYKSVSKGEFYALICFYLIFFIVGLWDDIKQISPKFRTIIILVALASLLVLNQNFILENLIFMGAKVKIELNIFSLIFTIFCFFALYNALNFIDGYNGVSCSVSIYWLLFLYINNNNLVYLTLLIIMFLLFYYNIQGKLFLGNSGTSILSIFFSVSIAKDYNAYTNFYADEILFLLFFPGIDMIRVTLQRILSKKKIYTPDKSHFHHYLIKNDFKYIWPIMLTLTILPNLFLYISSNMYITLILSIMIYLIPFLVLKKNSN